MKKIYLLAITICFLASCSQPPAKVENKGQNVYTKSGAIQFVLVNEGESLKSIARKFSLSPERILRANGLKQGSEVLPGMSLIIPVADSSDFPIASTEPSEEINKSSLAPIEKNDLDGKPVIGNMVSKQKTVKEVTTYPNDTKEERIVETQKTVTSEQPATDKSKDHLNDDLDLTKDETSKTQENAADKPAASTKVRDFKLSSPLGLNRFNWPVDGKVISGYGRSGNKFNDGINIAASEGTSVQAVDSGKIIYVGNNIEGYGNLVIVKHDGDFMSAYAHLKDVQIERGAAIHKGDVIGLIGKTGNVTEPQLHFSLRHGKKTIDPEGLLAK